MNEADSKIYHSHGLPGDVIVYDKNGEVTGLQGPGQTLNEHLSLMSGGAVDSFTDKVVYAATNKKPQYQH